MACPNARFMRAPWNSREINGNFTSMASNPSMHDARSTAPDRPDTSQPPISLKTAMPWAIAKRKHRGRTAYQCGVAAEDAVARLYADRGSRVIAQRTRTPHGEIDLIVEDCGVLAFVEVKRRKSLNGWDSPVSCKQWHRLKNSALHYTLNVRGMTGAHPVLRFDLALVRPDGTVRIIENARSFDEH